MNTRILGVDVDGGFAKYVVIPAENARPTDRCVPAKIAAFQDALGNAVHTVMAGPVKDQNILITGMGPIGLFAVSVCKALGARSVIGTEVSDYRIDLAHKIGTDHVLNPREVDLDRAIEELVPGGVDATLEMSGHPSSLALAIRRTRPGGRISLLGVFPESNQTIDMNAVIFKGIDKLGWIVDASPLSIRLAAWLDQAEPANRWYLELVAPWRVPLPRLSVPVASVPM